MDLSCLIDYIGLKPRCEGLTAPPSGLYIQSIAGIDSDLLDNISNANQANMQAVWNDVQISALARYSTELLKVINERIRIKQKFEFQRFGELAKARIVQLASPQMRGVRIMLRKDEGYKNVNIYGFHFYSNTAINGVSFALYDLDFGTVIDTVTADISVGYNSIDYDFSAQFRDYERNLFLCYDASLIDNFETRGQFVRGCDECLAVFSCDDDNDCCYYNLFNIRGGYISIPDAMTAENFVPTSGSYGLSLNLNVACDFGLFVCRYKEHFKMSWAYCLASEILRTQLLSNRVNRSTQIKMDRVQEGEEFYSKQFVADLKKEFYNLAVPNNSCFECNTRVRVVNNIS